MSAHCGVDAKTRPKAGVTKNNPRHYQYIDVLRGIAIFGVIAVHVSEINPDFGGISRAIVDQGARGVQLFFVASALTLSLSWEKRRDGLTPFYIRRLFRIAPLFWMFIGFFLLLNGFEARYFAPNGITIISVIQTIFFIHGWAPETITSVVPGSWSIADEMIFYVIFPAIITFCKSLRLSLIGFFLSLLIARFTYDFVWLRRLAIWPHVSDDLMSSFLNLWLPYQLPVFMVGICLYHIIKKRRHRLPANIANIFSYGAIVILVILPFTWTWLYASSHFYISNYTAYALTFALFAYGLSHGGGRLFNNQFFRFLGLISYSAYLWHFAILQLASKPAFGFLLTPYSYLARPIEAIAITPIAEGLKFCLAFANILAITIPLSLATYKYIEMPMVNLGRKVANSSLINSAT